MGLDFWESRQFWGSWGCFQHSRTSRMWMDGGSRSISSLQSFRKGKSTAGDETNGVIKHMFQHYAAVLIGVETTYIGERYMRDTSNMYEPYITAMTHDQSCKNWYVFSLFCRMLHHILHPEYQSSCWSHGSGAMEYHRPMRTLLHHGTHLGAGAEDFSRDIQM